VAKHSLLPTPIHRRLRIYTLDPALAARHDSIDISSTIITVRWEELQAGPVGEYLEVIDADPASECFYHPVNLNEAWVLATDGLAPSETNPMFHQQMVYAVAMTTIDYFERALGRVALWKTHFDEAKRTNAYVPRLRIYPHGLREGNAYYSPDKVALLFGYFTVDQYDQHNTPGMTIFTCLSHDIIAHETTHALLDGVHPRFNEPVNQDVFAFHEAFADVVALFQHFTYPGVLRDQIAEQRGQLDRENLLAQIAQQFGAATGRGTALRGALSQWNDQTNQWERRSPSVKALNSRSEPHDRGEILVAAVFGAFLKVYNARTADLYRIASEGTGVLRVGEIHPDLANRLGEEAQRCAIQVLQMCIRAIDYCAPVGITFGDYLRGIMTGDMDLNPDDPHGYRLAFVESFREWGIIPEGMRSMSIEALLWPSASDLATTQAEHNVLENLNELGSFKHIQKPTRKRRGQSEVQPERRRQTFQFRPWNLETSRKNAWLGSTDNQRAFWFWLHDAKKGGQGLAGLFNLVLDNTNGPIPPTVFRGDDGRISTEVHSVRTAIRRGSRGSTVTDLVVEITQRRRGYFDQKEQERRDKAKSVRRDAPYDFLYRAGCTLIISTSSPLEIRRVIRTPGNVCSDFYLEAQRKYLTEGGFSSINAAEDLRKRIKTKEPFAALHRHGGD
jgi:hypothetical protein